MAVAEDHLGFDIVLFITCTYGRIKTKKTKPGLPALRTREVCKHPLKEDSNLLFLEASIILMTLSNLI